MIYHTIFIFLQALLFIVCVLVDYFPSHTHKDTEVGTVLCFHACVRVSVCVMGVRMFTSVYVRPLASARLESAPLRQARRGADPRDNNEGNY